MVMRLTATAPKRPVRAHSLWSPGPDVRETHVHAVANELLGQHLLAFCCLYITHALTHSPAHSFTLFLSLFLSGWLAGCDIALQHGFRSVHWPKPKIKS